MAGVGDEQSLALGVRDDLAGEQQRAVGGTFHLRVELQRTQVQLALRLVLRDELADHRSSCS